jgi:hypothetical protein
MIYSENRFALFRIMRSARLLLRSGRRRLLHDRALQFQRAGREVVGLGLDQERVEAAIVVDALDRVGGDAQAHVAPQRVRDEGHVAQVRQEAPLGLDVGVADLVAGLGALGRQFAAPRHIEKSSAIPASWTARFRASRGFKNRVLPGSGGRIGRLPRGVKVCAQAKTA